jgi:DNA-binding transcriptional LysR family regulator
VQELKCERFHLVCPGTHPLAGKRSVALADLRDEEIVHLARSSSVRQHLEAAGVTARTGALEVEHLATVAALVSQGLGVSVVPELTLFHFLRSGLVSVPVRDKQLRRPILLARRKGKALSVAAKAMQETIVAVAQR